jgi:hypothetical protein
MRGGVYFPVVQLDEDVLREAGFGDQFMLRYMGHVRQLNVPDGCAVCTPQEASPEQDLNSVTGGNPERTGLREVENITVLFATGQLNLISGIG